MPDPTFVDRFWGKVNKDGPIPEYRPDLGQCWLWTAGQDGHGYGRATSEPDRKRNKSRQDKAYRVAFRLSGEVIPDDLCLDHLCRVPLCVRPSHLEPVTQAENIRRGFGYAAWQRAKTHCPQGHPYAEFAYAIPSRPTARYCSQCNNARGRERRARQRAERDLLADLHAEGLVPDPG